MTKPKSTDIIEETDIIEMKVSRSWIELITFCRTEVPYGQVCFKVANGEPGKLVTKYTERDIRFDKRASIPSNFSEDLG